MWTYEKKLQYPVKVKTPCPAIAKVVISQLGGPDGELGAATRYLQQRYSMPYDQVKGLLTDIGTEELAHIELVSAILYQLTRCLNMEQIKKSGFDTYFVDHTTGIYPQAASGVPFSAGSLQVTGDPLADLYENLAAEQKARLTYDNILRLVDDPDVRDPIKFLRAREIVHFQRFGDALRIVQENLDSKNFYAFNPGFDKHCNPTDTQFSPPCTTEPDCGCNHPAMPIQQPAAPGCGCNHPAMPIQQPAAPGCGCNQPVAPACGCGRAMHDRMIAPSCGCSQLPPMEVTPACGCNRPVVPPCACNPPAAPDPLTNDCGPAPLNCGCNPAARRARRNNCC